MDKAQATHPCTKCGRQIPTDMHVCAVCALERTSQIVKPQGKPDDTPVIETAVCVVGVLSIAAGIILFFVWLADREKLGTLLWGMSSAISGVVIIGFGFALSLLAKIERHLRKREGS